MTQYLLSVHGDGSNYATEEAMQAAFQAVDALNARLQAEGVWVFGGGLHPADTASVVDGRGVEPIMTDGPYLEAKEHIGGFWILELPDLDAALRVAAEASKACDGKVEVRPFQGE